MNKKQYEELCKVELPDLKTYITDKFDGSSFMSGKGHIKYILVFSRIYNPDTLQTICNFVDNNNLKLAVKPHKFANGKIGIQFVFR